jgi:hypothetical protein
VVCINKPHAVHGAPHTAGIGAFMSSPNVKSLTKSWESHECDQQFGQNENIDIGNSQRLRKQGNTTINKVSDMRPGLAKIIEKVIIS